MKINNIGKPKYENMENEKYVRGYKKKNKHVNQYRVQARFSNEYSFINTLVNGSLHQDMMVNREQNIMTFYAYNIPKYTLFDVYKKLYSKMPRLLQNILSNMRTL